MRLTLAFLTAFSVSVLANPVPFDPQILIDTGGDATDINYTGLPITVGPNGGGIFVFHNATGNPLSEIDLNLEFPMAPLPVGFTVQGTIPIPPSPVRQHSIFDVATFSGFDCAGVVSASISCIQLKFILVPGPLVPTDGNFILDFNDSAHYTEADFQVLDGTYTGGDLPGGQGSWGTTTGNVAPLSAVPEPSHRAAAACLGFALLAAWRWRRRSILPQ